MAQALFERSIELTSKDLDLLGRLCLPYKLISIETGISVPHIKFKVQQLAIKFNVENRTALVVKALQLGLVDIRNLAYRKRNGN